MTMLQCRCDVRGVMSIAGAPAELCHHTTLVEIETIRNEVMTALTRFDRDIEAEKIFQMKPNDAADYFVQTHVKSAGQVDALNARERKIMTAGFLRYMALMVHLNLLETLSEIRKEEA